MDIISELLNIPQEDILSSSSYRDEDGTLVINVTLVPKQLPCPACSCCTSHVKDYKIKSIKHSALTITLVLSIIVQDAMSVLFAVKLFLNLIPLLLSVI